MEAIIDKVKTKLWSFGYSVKDISKVQGIGYDLIVDKKYKVKVVKPNFSNAGAHEFELDIILAVVDGDEIIYKVLNVETMQYAKVVSPIKAFPKEEKH